MGKKFSAIDRLNKVFTTIETETMHVGFSNLDMWVSTGNYALNRLLSNRYDRGFMFGRLVTVYGESGSGKSLLLAQTAGNAQRDLGAYVVWVDTERATDDKVGQEWFRRAKLNIDENFQYVKAATFSDLQRLMSAFAKQYRDDWKKEDTRSDLPPVMFVIDSYNGLLTDTQWGQTLEGKNVGDQGQKAKQLGEVMNRTNHLIDGLPMLIAGVLHVFDNQDQHGARHKATGGNKAIFLASQSLMLSKGLLRSEDVDDIMARDPDDNKKVVGITSMATIFKSRYSKPNERTPIQIPWATGIDPYSGLWPLLLADGTVRSTSDSGKGSWFQYTNVKGETVKFQGAKEFRAKHAAEMMKIDLGEAVGVDMTPAEVRAEITSEENA